MRRQKSAHADGLSNESHPLDAEDPKSLASSSRFSWQMPDAIAPLVLDTETFEYVVDKGPLTYISVGDGGAESGESEAAPGATTRARPAVRRGPP